MFAKPFERYGYCRQLDEEPRQEIVENGPLIPTDVLEVASRLSVALPFQVDSKEDKSRKLELIPILCGHVVGTKLEEEQDRPVVELTCERNFAVVGTGVDPVTSRFSGARSTN